MCGYKYTVCHEKGDKIKKIFSILLSSFLKYTSFVFLLGGKQKSKRSTQNKKKGQKVVKR